MKGEDGGMEGELEEREDEEKGEKMKKRMYLDEHLGATIALAWGAVHRHGLPVTGELQGEVLLHQLLDDLSGTKPEVMHRSFGL